MDVSMGVSSFSDLEIVGSSCKIRGLTIGHPKSAGLHRNKLIGNLTHIPSTMDIVNVNVRHASISNLAVVC